MQKQMLLHNIQYSLCFAQRQFPYSYSLLTIHTCQFPSKYSLLTIYTGHFPYKYYSLKAFTLVTFLTSILYLPFIFVSFLIFHGQQKDIDGDGPNPE